MMKGIILVCSLFGILALNSAQIVQTGQCDDNIQLQTDFNVDQFMGTWYEVARTPSSTLTADCSSIELTNANGIINFYSSAVNKNFFEEYTGAVSQGTGARFTFTFDGSATTSEYWILSTDYSNYALAYRCENLGTTQRNVYIWQIGRTSVPLSTEIQTLISTNLQNTLNINANALRSIQHTENACLRLPVATRNEPVILTGQCGPDVPVVQNFNVAQFLGQWHEIASYYSDSALGSCSRAQYSLVGDAVEVVNSQVINQTLFTISGTASVASNDGSGVLNVELNVLPGVTAQQTLYIIATDYENYGISYACENVSNTTKRVFSWIIGRSPTLSLEAELAVEQAIDSFLDLNLAYYEDTPRSADDCFYMPEPNPSQSAVFRGQCDMNISAMDNFDPARYMGLWHDIESYPSEFQDGTCNNAYYTLTGAVVDVLNTQVIGQTLDTINGLAVIDPEANGTGKLLVTFPIAGTNFTITTSYWILSTDYDSYSFVYSCTNLDEDSRLVFGWKLSRTKQLTAAATTIINNAMANIDVLDQRYYVVRDQTETGCFYFPEPQAGVPVAFPGNCELNLPVVPNFNLQQFTGVWHEIEAYPKDQQQGTCINHQFSQTSATTLSFINNQVIDQLLQSNEGSVVTSDGSGRLELTIFVNNQTIVIPYWVIATDYSDYALIYSCLDIDSDFRGVYSWKLSRTKTLSAAANTAISNAISPIVVLDDRYYEPIPQTDNACFYFPESSSQGAVFPGTCDMTISAVDNFDPVRYMGLWHDIESYPSAFQNGTCNNAFYTLRDGVVDVFNTQVVDQTLDTIDGLAVIDPEANGSGKLLVTFPVAGTDFTVTTSYWILSTDYDSYSLVYSCTNLDEDSRLVFGWKLSRTKQLTAAATTIINNAMANINVLDQRYFVVRDQTETGCFYFPEPQAGVPVAFPGNCELNLPVVPNFNLQQFAGVWHEIEAYPKDQQQGTCINHQFSQTSATTLSFINNQVIDQLLQSNEGSVVTSDGSGRLELTIFVNNQTIVIPYWVIATDYSDYALIYSCLDIDSDFRGVYSWKLSRTKTLSAAANTAISNAISPIVVLDDRYYEPIPQTDNACFYFPESSSQGAVFPGTCDMTISAVDNFDPVRYMGLWHDIESYPSAFQNGTCNNAFYTLRDGVVDVFNTQVVDQTLDTIDGLAVIDPEANGSGKLLVTFPVAGTDFTVTTSYWILSTDYDSYSLVYSCTNLDEDSRLVFGWKLSRTKQLTAAATTIINNAMANINVLDQRYFVARDQTETGCFYFPEPQAGVPVAFPGNCELNLPVVPNFNLQQFSGLWHEIETYPKQQQQGQCINHQFNQTSATTLSFINNQVINQLLVTNEGNVVTDDGSGRLVLTIFINNQAIVIPFWVIATDYTDYALIYSCLNIDSDFRGVWSWKLSRTKTLSAAANTAINNAISPIDVLDNRYYETVSQTDSACFNFPDLSPNEPVIFDGLCDESIPVVTGFSPASFAGRWIDIESYYDDYFGSCGEAVFTDVGSNFEITTNQVVNQQLVSQQRTASIATDGSGRFTVTTDNETLTYNIVATDYSSYALVYSCVNIDNSRRRVRAHKISRTRQLDVFQQAQIGNAMNNIDILNDIYFNVRDQSASGCFYYADHVPGQPVTYRGQCDPNVAVVQNFDVARYLGLWYDIEHYPQGFQDGACATAQYSLGENGVDVYNTEVVNQQLSTINGTAVVASTDGSAKLTVTFPIEAVPGLTIDSPYWVLATDYDSYSLVYACTNIDEDNYRVTAWKLSRTQSLSANAITVINNIMDQVLDLNQQYFEETGHSEADCLYYPNNFGGPVILDGQCLAASEVNVVNNFNAALFAGQWHEASRYPSALQTGECSSTTLQTSAANSFTITQASVVNERLSQASGTGTVSADGRGVISAVLSNPSTGAFTALNLYVLATNYNDYALVYSCVNVNANTKQIYSWKLSRSRDELSQIANEAMNAQISNNAELFEGYYEDVDQSNDACFYYPVFDTVPEIIELPGHCDDSISGIPNFSPADYLGLWYEIASYPQLFQDGDCSRAEYTLGPDGVIVYNTQVINQTLDIMTGLAVVASDDGSGVLSVTFVVQGVTNVANYYIMATDYTDYAIVYSCRNLTNGNSQVSSWKLSRTPTLSAQANTVINNVIQNTKGLLEDYYTTTSQSDEACFYIPELYEDEAPVFRGRCEENVIGVQNFAIESYLGWWHEIERYPSENSAQCTSSILQVADSGYEVVDIAVSSGVGNYDAVPVVATNDGRLRRTYSDGRVVDTWVLATDYDTYSLLYSCENILQNGEEYRRVWSAKHSKQRTLTDAAENAMAPTIAANPVLVSTFYQPVDQSDQACFHNPEQNNQQVILPGQCAEDIPVVMDFDVIAYAGTWYQIERYPQIHETGVCTGARYAFDDSAGVVTVLNWEVINGTLDTIEGTAVPTYDDGSARLTVTLPDRTWGSNGTVVYPLYVLTTDYVSYSLAYSCVNVNDFQRAIGAFKLSRDRTMTADGDTAIRDYMENREELNQDYFLQVVHNEDCVEPSGGFIAKSSVIVILVCALLQMMF